MASFLSRIRQRFGKTSKPLGEDSRVPDGLRVYAIGDIHGRSDLLRELHELIQNDARSCVTANKSIVYLGDYVDRGLDSKGVIDTLLKPLEGFDCVHLKGNHEDTLLRYLDDYTMGMRWFPIGGDATVMSYGVRLPKGLSAKEREAHMWSEFQANIPADHLSFFSGLNLMHRVGDYAFVHAGVRPGTPIDQQNPTDLMWIRDSFLDCKDNFGAVVVHGHSTARKPEIRLNRIGIDTGAYATNILTCLVLEGATRRFLTTGGGAPL